MRCPPGEPTFRLLDPLVGFDDASVEGLTSPDALPGVALAPVGAPTLSVHELAPYLPPPRLAPGCDPCEWYLVPPVPPDARLLHRSRCSEGWQPMRAADGALFDLVEPVAVAAAEHRVAVADRGHGRVHVWAAGGRRRVASIPFATPAALAFAPDGDIVVAAEGSNRLWFFDPSGSPRRVIDTGLPGAIVRIGFGPSPSAAGAHCTLWVVTLDAGMLALWRRDGDGDFAAATLAELAESIVPSTLVAVTDCGFCLAEPSVSGVATMTCFDWYGREVDRAAVGGAAVSPLQVQGQLLTRAIDSGVPRCRWHRVRVDVEVPDGTSVEISVATSERRDPPPQGVADAGWVGFATGVPHPGDWQDAPALALDFLVQQPPGRHLFVRVRLRGDGVATPLVRRIRLDLPRTTSLDSLPAIYGEDPAAEDFTERFLSLFDASIEDLDRNIARHPALLDAKGVPESALPWLADFVAIALAPEWDVARRRRIVAAAPELYRERGTLAGLRRALELVFDVTAAIDELGPARAWGAVAGDRADPGAARLRSVRLFGTARARVRLGTSALSTAPIRSYGNADDDARTSGAYRLRVHVPPVVGATASDRDRVRRLVAAQAPAHTVADVRFGGDGFLLGASSRAGVDTLLAPLPAPVLGGGANGNVWLRRQTVLWPSRRGRVPGVRLDAGAVVGISTAME